MFGGPYGIKDDLPGEYLLDALFTVGPEAREGGPILWVELVAFAQGTGRISETWELEAVMAMSKAYYSCKNDTNIHSIPPFQREKMK
jgi:hypothetical protein